MKEKKQPEPLDLINYKKQGNLTVDMVCECIMHERLCGREPKAISLNKAYYQQFQIWVIQAWGEEFAFRDFSVDGVEIRQEVIRSGKALLIEYMKPIPAQV